MAKTVYRVILMGGQQLAASAPPEQETRFGVEGIKGWEDSDQSSWWCPLNRVMFILALDEDNMKKVMQSMREEESRARRMAMLGGAKDIVS